MQAIQNTMRRLIAVTSLMTIKATLLRLCGTKSTQPLIAPSEVEPDTVTIGDLGTDEDDTEDRFVAWEAERDDRLHEAEQYELEGLRLLNRAALLRAAQRCDDRGETFIAGELREHAAAIATDLAVKMMPGDAI